MHKKRRLLRIRCQGGFCCANLGCFGIQRFQSHMCQRPTILQGSRSAKNVQIHIKAAAAAAASAVTKEPSRQSARNWPPPSLPLKERDVRDGIDGAHE